MKLSTLSIIYSIAMSLGNWFCMSRKGGTGWYTHRVKTAWPCMGWLPQQGHFTYLKCNGDLQNSHLPCRASMQCLRTISFAQATYNKCLRTTDCNLVCSLEQESHTHRSCLVQSNRQRTNFREFNFSVDRQIDNFILTRKCLFSMCAGLPEGPEHTRTNCTYKPQNSNATSQKV